MALLDEFVIRYLSDTGALDRDMDASGKKSDDLNKKLSNTDDTAKKLGANLGNMAKLALGALTAALGASTLVGNAIQRAQDVVAIDQTAQALGESVGQVDAFGRAMETMGLDAQGARDSLTDMGESIGEAMQDIESGRAKTFKALGVSLRDINGESITASEGILRLADAVQDMDRSAAVFRIKELGITDNRMVEAILTGREALEGMIESQKAQGVITRENVEQARRFTSAMHMLRSTTSNASAGLSAALLPALTKVVEWLTTVIRFMGENRTAVVTFFGVIAAVVAGVYLPAMIAAASATLAATWPLIAIGAAVVAIAAAFALAADDIMAFVNGGESFIGLMFERFPMVEAIVFSIIDAFNLLGVGVQRIFDGIVQNFQWMIGLITAGVESITGVIGKVSGAISSVGGFLGIGGGESDNLAVANTALASAQSSPLNAMSSNAISNSSNVRDTSVTVGEIKIETQSTDAKGIASDINTELGSQLRDLDAEFSSGVAR